MRRGLACLLLLICLGCRAALQPCLAPLPSASPAKEASPAAENVTPLPDRSGEGSMVESRHLRQAAAALEQGRLEKACFHLAVVLDRKPDDPCVRYDYA